MMALLKRERRLLGDRFENNEVLAVKARSSSPVKRKHAHVCLP